MHRAGVDNSRVRRVPVPDVVDAFVRGEGDCAQMTGYHMRTNLNTALPNSADTRLRPDMTPDQQAN